MPYNSKILAKARSDLADIRDANAAEHERRLAAVYRRVPEIEQIDTRLRIQWVELAKLAFSRKPDKEENICALRESNLTLQMRKAELLTDAGYSASWLDTIYTCPVCHDSGNAENGICSCLKRLYQEELSKELTSLLHGKDESFARFDLTLYPAEYSEYFQCIPREYMGKVFLFCKDYAEKFPDVRENLLFQGSTGLGKSYLSACIARVAVEHGYSVVYDTAISVFAAFEKQKFSRNPEEADQASVRVQQILDCDLLIVDDLGTEVVTPVVHSALYTIVNSRTGEGQKTILNTTLYSDEMIARYGSPVCSRLEGYYKTIRFAGTDIRQLQKRG